MASVGPSGPSASSTDSSAGTFNWANASGITAEGGGSASVGLGNGQTSIYLVATGFGFSVPAGATINGVLVEWKRSADRSGISDAAVRLVKGGAVGSTDRSAAGSWPTTLAYQSYGGASDLWGTTLTPDDVNASAFGAAIRAQCAVSTGPTASVDYVRVTVYYSTGGATVCQRRTARGPVRAGSRKAG